MNHTAPHAPTKPGKLQQFTAVIFLSALYTQGQPAHTGPAQAIARSATLPAYDVVTIKQNKTDFAGFTMSTSDFGDRFFATNVPLNLIVEVAYELRPDQLSGLSGPVSSLNYDVEAKILGANGGKPPKLSAQQLHEMLIPMLGERFHLKAHLQSRILPVYDLVALHGGPKLPLPHAQLNEASPTARSVHQHSVNLKDASMADLAADLSDAVGRTVIDQTGLRGKFNFNLTWNDDASDEQAGLSVFTAIQEQLGLKLQPGKGPVDTLVVDQISMPSEN